MRGVRGVCEGQGCEENGVCERGVRRQYLADALRVVFNAVEVVELGGVAATFEGEGEARGA